MALILDKENSKKLEDRLSEIGRFGMTFYYLYEEDKLNANDLENVFFSCDDEKSGFMYSKVISHVCPSDLKKSFEKYKNEYPNINNLPINIYQENLNMIYTSKLINRLDEETNSNVDRMYVNTYNYLLDEYR